MGCFNIGFISTGCSTDSNYSANLTATNSSTISVLQSNTSSSGNQVSNANNFTLINGATGLIDCGTGQLQIGQTITGNYTYTSTIGTTQTSDLITTLQNDMSSQLNQLTTAQTELLASALDASSNSTVNETLNNFIQKNVTQATITSIINNTVQANNSSITNYGIIRGSGCVIDQDIVAKIIAANIIDGLQSAATSDAIISKMISLASQDTSTSSKGLNSIVDSIVSGITSIFKSAVFVYGIIIVAVIIGLIFIVRALFKPGDGVKLAQIAGDAAANSGGKGAMKKLPPI